MLNQPGGSSYTPDPPCVKRVTDIFEDPRFFVDGANAKDVRQGYNGDCWFLSALMAICNVEDDAEGAKSLVEQVCIEQNQDVGVYGFVLFRDGAWESVIIDDKLYLRKPDYEQCSESERDEWETNRIRVNSEEEYRREYQMNSRALWFAQSTHQDETWVPLLEKAYAKAHGDYGAIEGGWVGEGVEDLTGGASMNIFTADILSKDRLWADLKKVNHEFLFGCSTADWGEGDTATKGRGGLVGNHAYSILRAVDYKNEKLVLVKNPWGKQEWTGPWSDGSKEWTSDSIRDLDHSFGDDGVFWIRYKDLLRKYDQFYKTRLFTDDWRVTQQWVSCAIPWSGTYQDTKFEIVVEKAAQTVIMLSQLDERFFRGLVGQYEFDLSFRLHKSGDEDYIIRTSRGVDQSRSVHIDIHLEPGTYEVLLKVKAIRRDENPKVEDVVKDNWLTRREKLLRMGLSYDLAHAKAQVKDEKKEEEVKKEVKEEKKLPPPVKTTVTKTKTITETTVTETDFEGKKTEEKKVEKTEEKKKEDEKKKAVKHESEPGISPTEKKSMAASLDAAIKEDTAAAHGSKVEPAKPEKPDVKATVKETKADSEEPKSPKAKEDVEPETKSESSEPKPVTKKDAKTEEFKPLEEAKTTESSATQSGEPTPAESVDAPAEAAGDEPKGDSSEDKVEDHKDGAEKPAEEPTTAEEPTQTEDDDAASVASEESFIDDDVAEKRWGAVAVVGLRVYTKDADVQIRVIRPEVVKKGKNGKKSEGEDALAGGEEAHRKLDVDDPASDASKPEGEKTEDIEEVKVEGGKEEKVGDVKEEKKEEASEKPLVETAPTEMPELKK